MRTEHEPAAKSLGIAFCLSGFYTSVNFIPELKVKLGFDDPWRVQSTLCLDYPLFKQEGSVPRDYRPVTRFRPEVDGSVTEE